MENSQIYSMNHLEKTNVMKDAMFFVMAYDGEKRAHYSWEYLIKNGFHYDNVVVFAYDKQHLHNNKELMNSFLEQDNELKILDTPNDQVEFVSGLKSICFTKTGLIVIDISGMRTVHIFLLLKYLKLIGCTNVIIINTLPYDYIFADTPFVSYSSYKGDLELKEIAGYGGRGDMSQDADLFVFLGFEGNLSLKVVEDTAFKNLYLINTIPAYYQKYKDISIINNTSVLQQTKNRILHVPADNPFEVFNLLCSHIDEKRLVCLAPLSTKPISLGVCLYALANENVRVVYPVSGGYNNVKSHDVYVSYVYEIDISDVAMGS